MEQSGKYMQNEGTAIARTVQSIGKYIWLRRKFTGIASYIKKHPKEFVLQVLTFALLCLWIYVGSKKVFTYSEFRASMIKQPFADQYGIVLSYMLPVLELSIGILFIFERAKTLGLWLTILLMLIFSVYITLALLDTWGSIPCDCILEFPISWKAHLWINGVITIASIAGLMLDRKIKNPSRLTR